MSTAFETGRPDRRGLFRLAAGLGAAAALGAAPARSAAPAAAPANAAAYRFRVGALRATVVSDGAVQVPASIFAAEASAAELAEAQRDLLLPEGELRAELNVLHLDTGRNRVLVDTGLGAGPGSGALVANMRAAGLDPAAVDTVLLTHLHPDHVAGLVDASGAPVFANARLFVAEEEWRFWTQPNPRLDGMRVPEAFRAEVLLTVQRLLPVIRPRLETFAAGREVVPGVTALAAPGHTPGHVAVLVADGRDQLLHLADTVHSHAVNLRRPDWRPAVDGDPVMAAETRARLLERASAERARVLAYHFPFPGLGGLRRTGPGRHDWVAEPWRPGAA